MWKKDDIATKWPAARLLGPNVTVDQAEDFIWRTDHALQYPTYCCNDNAFCADLGAWLGYPTDRKSWSGDWQETLERRGQIELEHFGSHWVASSFIYGPHGPVHPNGEVRMANNIGKWPNTNEVEDELDVLAKEFPWLKFQLGVWDNEDGETEGTPDFAWTLGDGSWERVDVTTVFQNAPIPLEPSMESSLMGLLSGTRREMTWPLGIVKKKWEQRL